MGNVVITDELAAAPVVTDVNVQLVVQPPELLPPPGMMVWASDGQEISAALKHPINAFQNIDQFQFPTFVTLDEPMGVKTA
jgi:hypothetical protein